MQVLTAKEFECAEKGEVSYEINWIIPNWRQVRRDVSLVKDQKAIFETGSQPSQMIQTKWLVGLKVVPYCNGHGTARVYWQFLESRQLGSAAKLDVIVRTQLCEAVGIPKRTDEQTKEISPGDIVEEEIGFLDLDIGVVSDDRDADWINSKGEVQYELILTFKTPALDPIQIERFKTDQFLHRSRDQLLGNYRSLLNEDSMGDLKITTSDGIELPAHQNILKAQCPVFAGMLNSDLSESQTGMVKVDDISGKTMKILLHYFYTGDLLNGWRDPDTIVEFAYAAGKYHMTQVLNLLDDLLGISQKEEVSCLDVQLLDISGKLSLKNAEARLLQRVICKVRAVTSGEELFELFGYDSDEISNKVEAMADEKLGQSKALEILDDVFGKSIEQREFANHRGLILLALAQKNGLKTLEQALLKRFAEITSKFTTAEELHSLFGNLK